MISHPLSIRTRLTLWSSAVLGIAIVLFSVVVYSLSATSLRTQVQRQLEEAFATVEAVIKDEADELEEIDEHEAVPLFCVRLGDRTIHATSQWQALHLDDGLVQTGLPSTSHKRTTDGGCYRLHIASVLSQGQTYLIAVAVDETTVEDSLTTLRSVLVLGSPLAVILAVLGGYFLTGRLLAPVGAMAERARKITAESLTQRLPIGNPGDELGVLATSFNEALSRLEDAFERLRRFTSDASHELRTPLTAIRSVGEVALRDNLDSIAYRDVIGSMLEEADRLVRLVDNLLTLTRGDSGKWTVTKQTIDPRVVVDEVVDDLNVLAEEKQQDIVVVSKEPVVVNIDTTLLRHAVMNLVDNAIKYTPPEGIIRVVMRGNEDGAVVLEVIDQGPGIPVEYHHTVFERFARIDKGRTREIGGTGLGLAIAKWAVEANGGRIELESETGKGSTFRLIFPPHPSKGVI